MYNNAFNAIQLLFSPSTLSRLNEDIWSRKPESENPKNISTLPRIDVFRKHYTTVFRLNFTLYTPLNSTKCSLHKTQPSAGVTPIIQYVYTITFIKVVVIIIVLTLIIVVTLTRISSLEQKFNIFRNQRTYKPAIGLLDDTLIPSPSAWAKDVLLPPPIPDKASALSRTWKVDL